MSDDRLARRAATGDRGAFAVIFERHHQGLYRYCRAILRHDEDARDALQTTFTRAIAALDGEARTIAVKPWLYRIAHNEAVSLARRRRPQVDLDAHPEALPQAPGPDKQLIDSEQLRQLFADLQELPERQRSALLLRELNELGYDEIGAALETSEQAARQTVYEARVMLLELRQGREMQCEEVRRLISARDGRLLRPRGVRAHLRACDGCHHFRESIATRRSDLGALAPPLPAAAAAALLSSLFGGGGGGGWGGGGLIAALLGGAGTSAGSKGVATVAAITLAGGVVVTSDTKVGPPHRAGHDRAELRAAPPAVRGELRPGPEAPAAAPIQVAGEGRMIAQAPAAAVDLGQRHAPESGRGQSAPDRADAAPTESPAAGPISGAEPVAGPEHAGPPQEGPPAPVVDHATDNAGADGTGAGSPDDQQAQGAGPGDAQVAAAGEQRAPAATPNSHSNDHAAGGDQGRSRDTGNEKAKAKGRDEDRRWDDDEDEDEHHGQARAEEEDDEGDEDPDYSTSSRGRNADDSGEQRGGHGARAEVEDDEGDEDGVDASDRGHGDCDRGGDTGPDRKSAETS